MDNLFKISEFAAITGLTRRQLIIYDHENILHPAWVDSANGYRYYSYRQLEAAYIIARLRDAQVSLDNIRSYLTVRSPERLIEMCDRQEAILNRQIADLTVAKRAMDIRRWRAKRSLSAEPGTVKIMNVAERNLFLWYGFPEDGHYNRSMPWEYIPAFYEACKAKGIPAGFPVGLFVETEQMQERNWERASGFFCHLPVWNYPIVVVRPAGLFAVGTDYIGEGYPESLYQKVFSYIDEHGYRIRGRSYEEHLLHAADGRKPHVIQISIEVARVG